MKTLLAILLCMMFFHCSQERNDAEHAENSIKQKENKRILIHKSQKNFRRHVNFGNSIGRFPDSIQKIFFGYEKSSLFRVDTLCTHEFKALFERLKTQIAENKIFSQEDDYAFIQLYNTMRNHPADYQYEGFREENPGRDTMNLYFKKRQVFYSEVVDDEYIKLEEGYFRKIKNKYPPVEYHRNTVFYPSLNILSNFMFCNNCSCFYINFDCIETK